MHKQQFLLAGYYTVLPVHRRETKADRMFLQGEAALTAPDSG